MSSVPPPATPTKLDLIDYLSTGEWDSIYVIYRGGSGHQHKDKADKYGGGDDYKQIEKAVLATNHTRYIATRATLVESTKLSTAEIGFILPYLDQYLSPIIYDSLVRETRDRRRRYTAGSVLFIDLNWCAVSKDGFQRIINHPARNNVVKIVVVDDIDGDIQRRKCKVTFDSKVGNLINGWILHWSRLIRYPHRHPLQFGQIGPVPKKYHIIGTMYLKQVRITMNISFKRWEEALHSAVQLSYSSSITSIPNGLQCLQPTRKCKRKRKIICSLITALFV